MSFLIQITNFALNQAIMKANLVGERLLNYEIKRHLNSDELFDFYEAEHLLFDRRVLIKTLNIQAQGNPQAKEQLKKEATNKAFQHSQTLIIYDFIETAENAFLITDATDGWLNLEQYILRFGAMTEEKATRLFLQILEIIGAAHRIGLYHPCLNPQSILIQGEQVKVIGFEGTSYAVDALFASPEEKEKSVINTKANIFSLGRIFAWMLTGNAQIPKGATISHKLQEAILVATEHSPAQRFENCQEFAKALTAEVSDEEIEDKHAFTYFPLIVFGVLLSVFLIMIFVIGDENDEKSSLAYDLYDQTRIRKSLDSIRKAKRQEFIRDSIRIAMSKAENLQKIHIYKVKKGETLKTIAEKFNMSVSHIRDLNGMTEKTTLKANVGLRVVIREYHKVLDGEELWKIAQRYGVSKFEILKANDIEPADERDEFYPGKELIIPIKR
jgi:LysM repeat protein